MFDEPPKPSPFPHGANDPKKPNEGAGNSGGGTPNPGGQGPTGGPTGPVGGPGGQNPGNPFPNIPGVPNPGNAPSAPENLPQQIKHAPTNARVPEKVSRGVMATGALVIHGPQEFIIDFVQVMNKSELVARVVVPPNVAQQILAALQENFGRYVNAFGPPMTMPKPPAGERPKTAQEIYDDLKIPDEQLSGVYANAAMVGHTPTEFYIDFLTSFFPQAAVSSRVYISVPRMAGFIDTLSMSVNQYRKAVEAQQQKNRDNPRLP